VNAPNRVYHRLLRQAECFGLPLPRLREQWVGAVSTMAGVGLAWHSPRGMAGGSGAQQSWQIEAMGTSVGPFARYSFV